MLPIRMRHHLGRLPSYVNASWYGDVDECVGLVADAQALWVDFNVAGVDELSTLVVPFVG